MVPEGYLPRRKTSQVQITNREEDESRDGFVWDGDHSLGDLKLCGQRRLVLTPWGKITPDDFRNWNEGQAAWNKERKELYKDSGIWS